MFISGYVNTENVFYCLNSHGALNTCLGFFESDYYNSLNLGKCKWILFDLNSALFCLNPLLNVTANSFTSCPCCARGKKPPKSEQTCRVLLVCRWRHGGHVGGQEQKHYSPLGTKLYFHVNSSRKNYIVLTLHMAALSRGHKPRIERFTHVTNIYMLIYWNRRKRVHTEKSSTPTGSVWNTNMAEVTSCRTPYYFMFFDIFVVVAVTVA